MSLERFVKGTSERTAKFPLIRQALLTSRPSRCAQKAGFCAHFAPKFQLPRDRGRIDSVPFRFSDVSVEE